MRELHDPIVDEVIDKADSRDDVRVVAAEAVELVLEVLDLIFLDLKSFVLVSSEELLLSDLLLGPSSFRNHLAKIGSVSFGCYTKKGRYG